MSDKRELWLAGHEFTDARRATPGEVVQYTFDQADPYFHQHELPDREAASNLAVRHRHEGGPDIHRHPAYQLFAEVQRGVATVHWV